MGRFRKGSVKVRESIPLDQRFLINLQRWWERLLEYLSGGAEAEGAALPARFYVGAAGMCLILGLGTASVLQNVIPLDWGWMGLGFSFIYFLIWLGLILKWGGRARATLYFIGMLVLLGVALALGSVKEWTAEKVIFTAIFGVVVVAIGLVAILIFRRLTEYRPS